MFGILVRSQGRGAEEGAEGEAKGGREGAEGGMTPPCPT